MNHRRLLVAIALMALAIATLPAQQSAFRRGSQARQTSLMPPSPSLAMTS
jgi:hypothetical protein